MLIKEITGTGPAEAFIALRGLGMPFLLNGLKFSYAGAGPLTVVKTENGVTVVDNMPAEFADPFEALSALLKAYDIPQGPFPFSSGVVAYFSYDLKGLIEPKASAVIKKGLAIPECVAGIYDPVFVFDHEKEKGFLVSATGDGERFEAYLNRLGAGARLKAAEIGRAAGMRSDFTRDEYISAVARAKEFIAAGDIYQINLSQRLTIDWQGDPFALYLSLVERYPALYCSFLDYGGFQIISNSPENLLRVSGGVAETSPIKGTRSRGKTPEEDRALIEELKASRKEMAEHVMIVDLERNDLGKISVPGSVEVSSFAKIETYPHLHHMVSTVRGRLKKGISAPAALRQIFPGGSITGAPKIRAMEIIDALECHSRSIYTGGIGWFGFDGSADVAMAIRTAVYKDGELNLSVGGGIVADSEPEDEYRETLLKARDFLEVLKLGGGA